MTTCRISEGCAVPAFEPLIKVCGYVLTVRSGPAAAGRTAGLGGALASEQFECHNATNSRHPARPHQALQRSG